MNSIYDRFSLEHMLKCKLDKYFDLLDKIDKLEDNNAKRKYKKLISSNINIYSMFKEQIEDDIAIPFRMEHAIDIGGIDLFAICDKFKNNTIESLKNILTELDESYPFFNDLKTYLKDIDMIKSKSLVGHELNKIKNEFDLALEKNKAEDKSAFIIEDGVLIRYLGNEPIVYAPKGITSVASMAFDRCNDKVKKIYFSDELIEFQPYAFYFVPNLEFISIPNKVEKIGDFAFIGCVALSDLFIPASVNYIGFGAFGYCSSILTVSISANNEKYYEKRNCIIDKEDNSIIASVFQSTIPKEIKKLGKGAFMKNTSAAVIIPDNIEIIDSLSFVCSDILEIIIPKTVKKISSGAFIACHNLKNIVIESEETIIEENAFIDIPYLHRLVVPEKWEAELDKKFNVKIPLIDISVLTY